MFHKFGSPFCFTRKAAVQNLMSTVLAGLIGVTCMGGCFLAKPSQPTNVKEAPMPPLIRESSDAFYFDGHTIRVDRNEPDESGKHPAVLLLPGADGVPRHAEEYREAARLCARNGYVVLLVHYFDRFGIEQETDLAKIKGLFFGLMATVSHAVQYAAGLENVDNEHMALVGHSLGACLALSVAPTEKAPRIGAVVDFYGALPSLFSKRAEQMPPTLILHGEDDHTVLVQEAYDLERRLKENERTYEIHVYADQGHCFQGAAKEDATRRTLAFLEKHLKTPSEVASR
jgi:dienelactone hydrolase